MGFEAVLRTRYSDCLSTHCKDEGCSVSLSPKRGNRVLIDGRKYKKKRNYVKPLCDFILFDSDPEDIISLTIIELKGGEVDEDEARHAYKQLKNGALLADSMARSVDVKAFSPFLVKEKGLNSFARRLLYKEKYWITFRTFREAIIVRRSGDVI